MAAHIDLRVETVNGESIRVYSDPDNQRGVQIAVGAGDAITEAKLDFHELCLAHELLNGAISHLIQVNKKSSEAS